jgi:hypothetical protein
MNQKTLKSKISGLRPNTPATSQWQRQREHWLNWLEGYDGPGHYRRREWKRSASFIYNNLKSPVMTLWLGAAVGVPKTKVREAERAVKSAKANRAMQCAAIRKLIPWTMIEPLLNSADFTGRDFLVLWRWDEAERVQGSVMTKARGTHAGGLQRGDRMFVWATKEDELFLLGAIHIERSGTKWAEGKSLYDAFQIVPLKELKWKLRFQQSASDRLSHEGSLAWQVRARRCPTPETVRLLERRLWAGMKQIHHANNQATDGAASTQEKLAGFQSNPVVRRSIEAHSMKIALARLQSKGYKNIINTSLSRPYDYTCEKAGKEFFVEVKGTQTAGNTIVLTQGEVENVRENPKSCVLILVHSIKVSGTKQVRVSGGTTVVHEKWTLRSDELKPIQYVWEVT